MSKPEGNKVTLGPLEKLPKLDADLWAANYLSSACRRREPRLPTLPQSGA